MADIPEPLTEAMLDGSERIRVGRRMKDGSGVRTGPVKVWTTAIEDILKFARRVSPTVNGIVLSATGALSFTRTDGSSVDLGSVAGPAGPRGAAGAKGDKGDAGAQGVAGPQGAAGAAGPAGVSGAQGAVGPAGVAGAKGDAGAAGPQGSTGLKGDAGPAGTPRRVERYTAAANASGVATIVFSPAFAAAPDVDVIPGWNGDQEVTGGVTAVSATGCTVAVKVSRATLLLSAGPYQAAPSGTPVTVRAIG